MSPGLIVFSLVLAAILVLVWRKMVAAQRAEFIRHFALPQGLYERLRKRRPELSLKDCQLVSQALRQFFLAHLRSGRRFVSMPSQVADDLWHEFILYTKEYESFCRKAFGRFLHHMPAVVLGSARDANAGLRRCWWHVCREENINPRQPTRLPLLFALDAKLKVADGFHYRPSCGSVRNRKSDDGSPIYCGTDFSSSDFDGGTDGFGDSGSADGGGGDSGGGDSGGCGGGCGGGGD
ncbi:MAG: hypothetical protein U1E96_03475 [Azonexus sp.]